MTHGYGDMVADSASAGDDPDNWQTPPRPPRQQRRPPRDDDAWGSPGHEWSPTGYTEPEPVGDPPESRWHALEQSALDRRAAMDHGLPPQQLPRRGQRGASAPSQMPPGAEPAGGLPNGGLPESLSRRQAPRGPGHTGQIPRHIDPDDEFPLRQEVSSGEIGVDVGSPSVVPRRYVPRSPGHTGQFPHYTEDDDQPSHTGQFDHYAGIDDRLAPPSRRAGPAGRPTHTGQIPRYPDADDRPTHTGQIPRWSEPAGRPQTGQFPRYIEPDGRLSHTGQVPRYVEPETRPAAASRALPDLSDRGGADRRRRRRGRLVIFASIVLVALVAGGVLVAVVSRPGSSPPRTTIATTSPAESAKIASQQVDPSPLTVAEVFGSATIPAASAEGVYHVVKSQIDAHCADAATDKVSALLGTLGCTQVVRATMTSADGAYVVTAGVFNLPDAAAATAARTSLKPLVDAAEGRLSGFDAGGATTVITQAPTHVGWDSRGHYLMYVVVALASGKTISTTDSHPPQIIADVMEDYLGDTVIGAREGPAASAK